MLCCYAMLRVRREAASQHNVPRHKRPPGGDETMSDPMTPRPFGGRRQFLAGGLAALAAPGLLPGRALAADVPYQFDGSKFKLQDTAPNPKRGGVLRVCCLSRQPHFD